MKIDLSGNRRTFFKQTAIFGWLGVLFFAARPSLTKPKSPQPTPAPSGRGYLLTEHVKKYYATARSS